MTLFINLLQANAGGGAGMGFWIMIIAMFAILYFFMIRPQQKRQKEITKFRNSIEAGMDVVTYGGVHGKVVYVDDKENTVTLEIAQNVKIVVEKTHIFASGAATQNVR